MLTCPRAQEAVLTTAQSLIIPPWEVLLLTILFLAPPVPGLQFPLVLLERPPIAPYVKMVGPGTLDMNNAKGLQVLVLNIKTLQQLIVLLPILVILERGVIHHQVQLGEAVLVKSNVTIMKREYKPPLVVFMY